MLSIRLRTVVTCALVVAIAVVASGRLEERGLTYTEAGLKRALVAFGISRTLNGVISVAQGTEVAVEPVGIGVTFTPGQILDPVNDLIERFSTVVLVAGTAFGAQRVLLEVTSSTFFTALCVSLAAASVLAMCFWGRLPDTAVNFLLRLAVTTMFLRLAVPLFAIGGELFYHQFLADQYQQSSDQLSSAAVQLSVINEESHPLHAEKQEQSSFLDSAREWINGASATMDWRQQLAEFSATAERISQHAIKLMVVFVFQTVFLPIFAGWLLIVGTRNCWSAVNLKTR